jgi:hypothetical protein
MMASTEKNSGQDYRIDKINQKSNHGFAPFCPKRSFTWTY